MADPAKLAAGLEQLGPERWARYILGFQAMAPFHQQAWRHLWAIEPGIRPRPLVGLWGRGLGKALALDTPIPTPNGWRTMGDIAVGDLVFDEAGKVTAVTSTSTVDLLPASLVRFDDGSSIVASDDHLWTTLPKAARTSMTRVAGVDHDVDGWWAYRGPGAPGRPGSARAAWTGTTAEMAQSLHAGRREFNHAIPLTRPLDLPDVALPLDPYVFGAWLGDGTNSCAVITAALGDARHLAAEIERAGLLCDLVERGDGRTAQLRFGRRPTGVCLRGHQLTVSSGGWPWCQTCNAARCRGEEPPGRVIVAQRILREMGVLNHKHIPAAYLRASVAQRWALLQGLMDTDGTVHEGGKSTCILTTTSERLAADVAELAHSLGIPTRTNVGTAKLNGRAIGPKWNVVLRPSAAPFRLERKVALFQPPRFGRLRRVVAVEPVGRRAVKCITVDSPSRLYLAGSGMVPTHNSSTIEGGLVSLGARRARGYVWYISANQDMADAHVASIASVLESPMLGRLYPDLADRAISKHGNVRGWRRNRLWTKSGLVIDAAGLETGLRGARVEDRRPDVIVLDDIDNRHDSPSSVTKKIEVLTESIIPAGSTDVAVIFIQNLIHPNSIATRLAEGRAEFLLDRVTIGPVPAVEDLEYELIEGADGPRWRITHGSPTWEHQSLAVCEDKINTEGITSFLRESQHEIEAPPGGMFDHLTYRRCDPDEVPDLVDIQVWVDPAVSSTDESDCQGIQVDGVAANRTLYRLHSWEERSTPQDAIRRALRLAVEYGASAVGIETDQGGDTWKSVFREQWRQLTDDQAEWAETLARRRQRLGDDSGPVRRPRLDTRKAGSIGSKVERASRMLTFYETRPGIVHVRGTHLVLERALNRFPRTKPFDLTDAAVWSSLAFLDRPARQGAAMVTAAGVRVDGV